MVQLIEINSPAFNEIIKAVSESAAKIGFDLGQKMSKTNKIGGYELAQEITGYSYMYLRNLVSKGKIPHIKIEGQSPTFKEVDLIKWMEGK